MAPHPLYELAIEITQIYRTGINVTRVIFEQDGDLEWERQMLLRYIDQHDQKVCAFLEKTLFDVSRDDLEAFSRVAGKLRNAFENEYILLEYERATQVTSR